MLTVISPRKAIEYFENRLEFTIDPTTLKEAMEKKEVNIIDVRAEKDFRVGHIPDAVNLPQERWDTFEGLTRDKTNVIYCYSITCLLASRAARYFAENDYPVMELIGGFEEWKEHKMEIEK